MTQRTSPTTFTTPAWNSVEQTETPNLTKHSTQSWSSSTSSHGHSNLHQHSLIHQHHHHPDSEKSPLSSSSSPASPSPSSSSVASSHASIHFQNQVEKFLKNLGLSEYIHTFLGEGFDTMISIEAITEDDMEHMSIKRGHRRVLQRALSARNIQTDQSVPSQPIFSLHPSHLNQLPHTPCESLSESGSGTVNPHISIPLNSLVEFPNQQFSINQQQNLIRPRSLSSESNQINHQENWTDSQSFTKTSIVSTPNFQNHSNPKRKYQRHPKPDLNAPEKPLSAYVMFSNQVREELKGQQISFTEIARLVGDRWKNLCPQLKDSIINRAAEAKNVWSLQMDQYKKTPEYVNYQAYVKEFKVNHGKSKSSNRPSSSSGNQPINSSHQKPKINSILSPFRKPEEVNKSEEEEEEEAEEEEEEEGEESYSESEVEQGSDGNPSSKRIKLSSIETHLPFSNLLTPLNHPSQPNSSTSNSNPMDFFRRSSTNNTFCENAPLRDRGIRLPVDLRHLTSLASTSSFKDSKI